jgi:predicted ribosome quality control (RQC) complex YloA/Tae2 family protein
MQTALHIRALVDELTAEIVGGKIIATEFYKKERATWFFVRKDKSVNAFGLVYHPAGSGGVLIPARKAQMETREKPWPIFQLVDAEVRTVSQPTLDRFFYIDLVLTDGTPVRLAVEAIGPNGNIWLLDADNRVKGTLRNREFGDGQPYAPMPLPAGRLDPFALSVDRLGAAISERQSDGSSLVPVIERQVIGFNRTMAVETIKRANLDFVEPDSLSPDDLSALVDTVKDIAGRFVRAEVGYLYRVRGVYEAYPFKLSSKEDQPEKLKSLSLAVMETINRRQSAHEDADEQKRVIEAVTRAVKRLVRRIENLDQDIARAADFEKYKRYGDILQIHRAVLKKGMERITLPDPFEASGAEVTIPLEPAQTPQDNIEEYFKKHRKGREGLETLERRLEISRSELEELRSILNQLELNFESTVNRFAAEIAGLLPQEAARRDNIPRLPYRPHTLSTGVTIYIGKDGADNDRTTFEFARPYELWFHAQQCPGSHVVMKFPGKTFEPSKQEIAETAAIAAWHSKARNDSLVPVIYTERKYVRKPRKAKPGLVTVERERSVMVQPTKPGEIS